MQIKHGFTMMELMVAMTISSIIILTAYAYYARNVNAFHYQVKVYFENFDESISLLKKTQEGFLNISRKKRRAYRLVRPY